MSYFGGFWGRVKRATTFHRYRPVDVEPRLGSDGSQAKTVRSGTRRWKRKETPRRRFHGLAWPGYFMSVLGPAALWGYHVDPDMMSEKVPFGPFAVLFVLIGLVFTARAAFAPDTPVVRIPATLVNAITPVAYALYFTLV